MSKTVACITCGRNFTRTFNLHRHEEIVHKKRPKRSSTEEMDHLAKMNRIDETVNSVAMTDPQIDSPIVDQVLPDGDSNILIDSPIVEDTQVLPNGDVNILIETDLNGSSNIDNPIKADPIKVDPIGLISVVDKTIDGRRVISCTPMRGNTVTSCHKPTPAAKPVKQDMVADKSDIEDFVEVIIPTTMEIDMNKSKLLKRRRNGCERFPILTIHLYKS
jgi:hypothetical protein